MRKHTKIVDLSYQHAKSYFKESKQYCSFELPPYFNLNELLLVASDIVNKNKFEDVFAKNLKPSDCENVNYTILSNKDGSYGWRPLQLIHPALYIDLVSLITSEENWKKIQEQFKIFSKSYVECISIPIRSETTESNKAETITNWWEKIEQRSIALALDYRYIFKTDISNCYGSIYTHSFEWAFHQNGRKGVKKQRSGKEFTKNLGSAIDIRLRNMNQGQTIGIPQGSALMDFFAEIILGGTDIELTEEIKKQIREDQDFKILRYRDDYRIFTNDFQTGHMIMKILNGVLYKWNLKMNATKTLEGTDLISESVKVEKLQELINAPVNYYYQKQIMRIYLISKKYPNAGIIVKYLTDFYDEIEQRKRLKNINYEVVIVITAMVAFYSPKYIAQVASIISKLIEKSSKDLDRDKIIQRIKARFTDLPNTEFIDIWLQRIASESNVLSLEFSSNITKVAIGEKNNSALWNSDWLEETGKNKIEKVKISSLKDDVGNGRFNPIIERDEFELYRSNYNI